MPGNDPSLRDALERLLEQEGAAASPSGPITSPVDRFAHLPEPTRRFIEELRPDDLDDLRRILQTYRKTGIIVWFFKWIIITVASSFVAAVIFGEKILTALSWLKGGPR